MFSIIFSILFSVEIYLFVGFSLFYFFAMEVIKHDEARQYRKVNGAVLRPNTNNYFLYHHIPQCLFLIYHRTLPIFLFF